MPRTYVALDALDNAGSSKVLNNFAGLNTTVTNDLLQDFEPIIRKNWGHDETGALQKVNGFTKKNATKLGDTPVRGLFRVYKSAGSDELLAVSATKLYYSDNEGTSFTGATGGTGLSATDFFTGVNYNDLFFLTSQTDNLQYYTPGTNTMAASTDQPTVGCKVLLKRADRRMIALVNSTNGSTVYWSKIDPTGAAADDWSATGDAGSIALDGVLSDPLTGGVSLGTYDLIYKDYTAFKVWDYPNTKAVRIIGAPGAAAPYSIVQGGGFVFSLAHDAVYMWDGVGFTKLSEPIKNIIAGINTSQIQNAFGVYRNGFYWLFYAATGSSVTNKCIVYDVLNSNPYDNKVVWYERDDLAMNVPLVLDGVGDNNELYAGDSASTGFVYQLDNGTSDNTVDITSIYQSKYLDMELSNVVKRFSKIFIEYYNVSGTFTVEWFTDRGATTSSYTITETGGNTIDVQLLPGEAVGKDISIKITHVGSGTAPIVRNVELEWEALYQE